MMHGGSPGLLRSPFKRGNRVQVAQIDEEQYEAETGFRIKIGMRGTVASVEFGDRDPDVVIVTMDEPVWDGHTLSDWASFIPSDLEFMYTPD